MNGFFYRINKSLFSFTFINDTDESHSWMEKDKWSHYDVLDKLIAFMRKRNFKIKHDNKVAKTIKKDYWYGRKGNLEFVMHRYPKGFSFEFFQNIIFKNNNGGQYDFDKFEKAPYLIRLQWINETKKMGEFLDSLGIKNKSPLETKDAEEKIVQNWRIYSFNKIPDDFKLSDMIGKDNEPNYNSTDRDNNKILNGDIKYFRNRNGRLMRGKVYHNINNMWWVILNNTDYTNIADFELFDPTEEDFKIRRKAKDRKPKKYIDKIENIKNFSNKELLRELKRRGLKVS